ncbi:serine/threonine-protein kinase [Anthocerotibacter panamensis]|uniref:serine/threonine-protein kinase n=1 Tax=Anthocerotibacter panamensis TaxID=2857077 RepID=UPI001C402D61|nr:serine/threonine-protein kinase [Anthocerotibacter panamensis]
MNDDPCTFCGQMNVSTASQCVVCGAILRPQERSLTKGTTLKSGRYHLGRVLGEGGFGITYQGTDLNLGRAVALKEFFPQGATRQGTQMVAPPSFRSGVLTQMTQEFLEEARTLSLFDHPHIVPVFDSFEENSTAYMVMQYVPGRTLEEIVLAQGALPEAKVVAYLQQVGQALERVHSFGVLHRDIKPGNILVTPEDRAILIDFGSARKFVEGLTQKQTQIITSGFAPPEQYALQAHRGCYTDIYALAATAYYLLSGQIPTGAMDRLFGNALADLTTYQPNLTPRTHSTILAGMALRIEERPQTVGDFLRLLREIPTPQTIPPSGRKVSGLALWLRPRVSQTLVSQGPVTSLAFDRTGSLLASAGPRGFAVWDLHTYEQIGALGTDGSNQQLVMFSPDGASLYTAGGSGQVTLWDIHDRRIYHALSRLGEGVAALAFSPDGIFLALGAQVRGTSRQIIKLIALNDGSCYWTFRGHPGVVNTLHFSADGQALASGGSDGSLRLWQVGQEDPQCTLSLNRQEPTAVALHPDQQQLAVGTRGGMIQLWQIPQGRLLTQNQQPLAPVRAVAFHPGGYLLVGGCMAPSGQWGAGVHLWDVVTSRQRLNSLASPLRQAVTAVGFAPDGQTLACATDDGQIHLLTNQPS